MALSQLQSYSNYSTAYALVNTGSITSGNATGAQFISQQNVSVVRGLAGVNDVFGMTDTEVSTYVREPLSKTVCPGLPQGYSCVFGFSVSGINTTVFSKIALPYEILKGHFPKTSEGDAIAIDQGLSDALNVSIGDNLVFGQFVQARNGSSELQNVTAAIVGVYAPPPLNAFSQLGSVMDINRFSYYFPAYRNLYSSIWVSIKSPDLVQQTGQALQSLFPHYQVYYPQSVIDKTVPLLRAASNTYALTSIVTLAAATLSIISVRILDYQSRKTELGLYIIQGWSPRDIFGYEMWLGLEYGAVGAGLALVLGLLSKESVINLIGFGQAPISVPTNSGVFYLAFMAVVAGSILLSFGMSLLDYSKIRKALPIQLIR